MNAIFVIWDIGSIVFNAINLNMVSCSSVHVRELKIPCRWYYLNHPKLAGRVPRETEDSLATEVHGPYLLPNRMVVALGAR